MASRFSLGKIKNLTIGFTLGPNRVYYLLKAKIRRLSKEGIYNIVGLEFEDVKDQRELENSILTLIEFQKMKHN